MRAVIVMFDSLNRHFLQTHGCTWTSTPNFLRLASKSATFDNSYVCSMPCMPARRDFHTGRPNFLHRSWGPIEPFDDSVPEMLKNAGVYTHIATDHQHYWEDGGCTYHTRYSSFDLVRGQEGDPWIGSVAEPEWPDREIPRRDPLARQDIANRSVTSDPEHFPMNVTFRRGIEFIRQNRGSDRWMLHLETFDPHEPFFTLAEHRLRYPDHFRSYRGKPLEWPPYREVRESREAVDHCRHEYAALVSACDQKLGEILDLFDELHLWDDTKLVVWTDHGFLLGEHGCWAKCWMPFYNEIARTPFFVWDPRHPNCAGKRRAALVQPAIDLGPTLLDFFGLPPAPDMSGKNLAPAVSADRQVKRHAIFGIHGGHANITDGTHVYMRGPVTPDNRPLHDYTLMPTHMRTRFHPDELKSGLELAPPFSFTKDCPTLKIPVAPQASPDAPSRFPTRLYRVDTDPAQESPLSDPKKEASLCAALRAELEAIDAPREQLERLGL